jgi:hypothetical protein
MSRSLISKFFILSLLAAVFPVCAKAGDYIWIEGEAAKSNSMTRHPWWYDKVKKGELSGGDYISNWGDKPGEALYEFTALADKEYVFWVRANPLQAKLSYQLDNGEWTSVDFAGAQEQINLAEDNKPDLRFIAWTKAGAVKLTKGAHTIRFRMNSENHGHGMLDCFVFTAIPFTPSGMLKPGEKAPAVALPTQEGSWPFATPRDEFNAEALFDLRSLNEKTAGESGYVTRSKDGNDFLLGNGKPARFWALNTNAYARPNVDLARHARFLAKRGVNMVRFHGNLTPEKGDLASINAAERDQLWKLVAAMKKEGIYTTFSPYWAVSARQKPEMGELDSGGNGNMGLLFFDKKLQEAYKSWMKQVLTEKNPYTGIPLASDPALAVVQIQNEDSLLFWSSQKMAGAAGAELRRQFGDFLKKKYETLEKAGAAWGGVAAAGDNFAGGEVGLYIIWELTQRRGGANQQKRCADQMQFMTMVMYNFNKMVADYVHNDLGCKALINAGNWRTADNVLMLDAERYSYSPTEIMGVNRYYDCEHEGPNNGWAIVNGDKFVDESVLLNPRALPVTLKQVDGYPMIISESSWVPPFGYQAEGPFMIAAYQSLNGVDAYYWFATGEEDWRQPGSANGYMPSEGKWVCATPMLMGQWPAAALLYRMGYVKKGEPAVFERRALADLWERKMPIIAEDAGYDVNRDKDNLSKESNVKDGVNPLAHLVGPIVAKYDSDPAKSIVTDMKGFIDETKKLVRSNTNELELDYGSGVCKLNAPKAQGACGFMKKAGAIKLDDAEIQCGNDYASILLVSQDDKPLKLSGRILVQLGTIARPTGWKTKPAAVQKKSGLEILDFGHAPWQIVNGDATITIKNSSLKTAQVLDANGMKVKEIPLEADPNGKRFKFPADALYVVLQ